MKGGCDVCCKYVDEASAPEICRCPLCLGILDRPNTARCCGKSFCLNCITKALCAKQECPCCRKALSLDDLREPDQTLNQLLQDLKVYCLNHPKCEWEGPRSILAEHLERTCTQVVVECTNAGRGCVKAVSKGELSEHLKHECSFREGEFFVSKAYPAKAEIEKLRSEVQSLRLRTNDLEVISGRAIFAVKIFLCWCAAVFLGALFLFRLRIRWD
jgi:hypothetical protein